MNVTDMLTVREAAMYLRTGPKTVYPLVRAGRLPAVNVARPGSARPRWRLSKNALDSLSQTRDRPGEERPGGLTEEQKKRIAAYGDGLSEEVRESIHRGSPIVAWRCKACWCVTYVEEFTTGDKSAPAFCSGCGMKATPEGPVLPENFVYEGRYEAAQPWAETKRGRGRR